MNHNRIFLGCHSWLNCTSFVCHIVGFSPSPHCWHPDGLRPFGCHGSTTWINRTMCPLHSPLRSGDGPCGNHPAAVFGTVQQLSSASNPKSRMYHQLDHLETNKACRLVDSFFSLLCLLGRLIILQNRQIVRLCFRCAKKLCKCRFSRKQLQMLPSCVALVMTPRQFHQSDLLLGLRNRSSPGSCCYHPLIIGGHLEAAGSTAYWWFGQPLWGAWWSMGIPTN